MDKNNVNNIIKTLNLYGLEEGQKVLSISLEQSEEPALMPWVILSKAHIVIRERAFTKAHELLERVQVFSKVDEIFTASLNHYKGTLYYHEGSYDNALSCLNKSLELFGREHFCTGRVLDTFGMLYSSLGNLIAAKDFFEEALKLKKSQIPPDKSGIALTLGQLGRLNFEWGDMENALNYFKEDLEISLDNKDFYSVCVMKNQIARVMIEQKKYSEAMNYLKEALSLCEKEKWKILEGFIHKDISLVLINTGDYEKAQEHLDISSQFLVKDDFPEGIAHIKKIEGILKRETGLYDEAIKSFQTSIKIFDEILEFVEAAKVQFELCKTLINAKKSTAIISKELVCALNRAEKTRRDYLIRLVEKEFINIDPLCHSLEVYKRVRGRMVKEDTVSFTLGTKEEITVFFFDIQDFTVYSRSNDPEVVFMTINQIFYEISGILNKHSVSATQYLGDGFMAISRGLNHEARAVKAAIEIMSSIDSFNAPRKILSLPLLKARIGINSGFTYLGNVGTHDKIDFTAVGTTTNIAARIQHEGETGFPCISIYTYEKVKDMFNFSSSSPRAVILKGVGDLLVWDVTGLKENE